MQGKPDMKHVSTCYAERNNLKVRMHSRRMTRLTNAFSKKMENHAYAMALHFLYYNFVCIHQTLKITPAMAAGVTDRLWEVADIVSVLEAWETSKQKGNIIDKARGLAARRYRSLIKQLRLVPPTIPSGFSFARKKF
jgi:hypothetical protein